MIPYTKVLINRSEATKIQVEVPPWELPILEIVNGRENCEVVGTRMVPRELPDAVSEYDRLVQRYARRDEGNSPVAAVYGISTLGVNALDRAINQAAAAADDEIRPRVVDETQRAAPNPSPAGGDLGLELLRDDALAAKGATHGAMEIDV